MEKISDIEQQKVGVKDCQCEIVAMTRVSYNSPYWRDNCGFLYTRGMIGDNGLPFGHFEIVKTATPKKSFFKKVINLFSNK